MSHLSAGLASGGETEVRVAVDVGADLGVDVGIGISARNVYTNVGQ